LDLQPQDRLTLVAIAEKLKLAADTFRAVRSEIQATQALALRDKALSMAALMDPFALEEAA
jgi:3-methyladenine DNA glycosylase AlkD